MTDTTTLPTSVTIAAGYKVMVTAQTASRDYGAQVVPGTYPIRWTSLQGYEVPPEDAYYASIRVKINSPERTESTAEFAGVAIASRKVDASIDDHTLQLYAYTFRRPAPNQFSDTWTFGYDA